MTKALIVRRRQRLAAMRKMSRYIARQQRQAVQRILLPPFPSRRHQTLLPRLFAKLSHVLLGTTPTLLMIYWQLNKQTMATTATTATTVVNQPLCPVVLKRQRHRNLLTMTRAQRPNRMLTKLPMMTPPINILINLNQRTSPEVWINWHNHG